MAAFSSGPLALLNRAGIRLGGGGWPTKLAGSAPRVGLAASFALGGCMEMLEVTPKKYPDASPACVDATFRCLRAQPQTCADSMWVDTGLPCVSAALCNEMDGTCAPAVCTPHQWSCSSDGKGDQQCNADGTGLLPMQGSDAGSVCREPRPQCTSSGECEACTASVCQGATVLRECVSGVYQDKLCASPARCVADPSGVRCAEICDSNFEGNTEATGRAYPLFGLDLVAQPLIPSANAMLLRLGLRTLQGQDSEGVAHRGGIAHLALYADANGEPGSLVAPSQTVSLSADSSNLTPVFASDVSLTRNVRYWIVALLEAAHSDDLRVYQTQLQNGAGHFRRGRVASGIERDPLPPHATSATSGGRISLLAEMRPCGPGVDTRPCVEGKVRCSFSTDGETWEICRNETCVNSPTITLGSASAASWSELLTQPANQWRLISVRTPRAFKAFSLNAILGNVPASMSLRMALWADAAGAFGAQPGTLVADPGLQGAVDGVNELVFQPGARPTLMAGERYWIGIILSQETATLPARAGHERVATFLGKSFHDDPAKELSTFPAVRPSGESDLGLFLRGKEVD